MTDARWLQTALTTVAPRHRTSDRALAMNALPKHRQAANDIIAAIEERFATAFRNIGQ